EGEEADVRPAERTELRLQGLVLAIEHRQQALARHVAGAVPVSLVAEGLVVGADGLGDGARCSADPEEPVGDLLTGTDLGKRPVVAGVEVELERLPLRARGCFGTLAR